MTKFKEGDIVRLKDDVRRGNGHYVENLQMQLEVIDGEGFTKGTFKGKVTKSNHDEYFLGFSSSGWSEDHFVLTDVYQIGDKVEITYEGIPDTFFENTEVHYTYGMSTQYPKGFIGEITNMTTCTNQQGIDIPVYEINNRWYWPKGTFKLVSEEPNVFNQGDIVVGTSEKDNVTFVLVIASNVSKFSGVVLKTTSDSIKRGFYKENWQTNKFDLANIDLKFPIKT
jgi:hypothetical protein